MYVEKTPKQKPVGKGQSKTVLLVGLVHGSLLVRLTHVLVVNNWQILGITFLVPQGFTAGNVTFQCCHGKILGLAVQLRLL
jgi:hypothetical protein